ncbi:MAG: Gfo/Idh/MocA family oxidoreductase [Chitinophagaceae bacterium]|nr:Gfo/Idh/MocA family oxidoreductase [Chitinophagaceae bacterium]
MNKTKFAIVGCGQIAKKHLIQIEAIGTLVAVCDSDPARMTALINQPEILFFSSLEKLLSARLPIDVIVICTPNGLHASQAQLCLNAGYHVLVEKPLALTEKDALATIETAIQSKRYLFTVLQNRFNDPVKAVYQAIRDGKLGNIFSVQVSCFWHRDADYYEHSWHGDKTLDGGVLFTQFSHFIDLLLWYFGEVKELSVMMHNVNHPQTSLPEDEGAILLRFEKDIIGTVQFTTNAYQKNMEGSITIIAEKGTIKIGGAYLNEIVYQETESLISAASADSQKSLEQVYHSMLCTLQYGEPYYVDPKESVNTIALIERIYKAANN